MFKDRKNNVRVVEINVGVQMKWEKRGRQATQRKIVTAQVRGTGFFDLDFNTEDIKKCLDSRYVTQREKKRNYQYVEYKE